MGLYTHADCINSVICPVCVFVNMFFFLCNFFICVHVVVTVTSALLVKQLANMLIKTTPAAQFTTPIKHTHTHTDLQTHTNMHTQRAYYSEIYGVRVCVWGLLQFTGQRESVYVSNSCYLCVCVKERNGCLIWKGHPDDQSSTVIILFCFGPK